MTITVYGHPASQPSRTVFWACLLGEVRFALGNTAEVIIDTNNTNPRGQIPSISDDGFNLAEAPAIVWYLAQKNAGTPNGLTNLYPDDIRVQARVHQFINMYHTLVRLGTYHLMAPYVIKPLNLTLEPNPLSLFQNVSIEAAFSEEDPFEAGGRVVKMIAGFLDNHYFYDDSSFLCGSTGPTLADLVCYSEIAQLAFARLFDFEPYPKLTRWLATMRDVPYHDAANAYNIGLGDIRSKPNTIERFMQASRQGLDALLATGFASPPGNPGA